MTAALDITIEVLGLCLLVLLLRHGWHRAHELEHLESHGKRYEPN